jgi:hypothetical protein
VWNVESNKEYLDDNNQIIHELEETETMTKVIIQNMIHINETNKVLKQKKGSYCKFV